MDKIEKRRKSEIKLLKHVTYYSPHFYWFRGRKVKTETA